MNLLKNILECIDEDEEKRLTADKLIDFLKEIMENLD